MKNSLILIFGMTGDLSKRKLIPGLYYLLASGKIEQARIIGAAVDGLEQMSQVLEQAKQFIVNFDPVVWQKLIDKFSYCQVDINCEQDFIKLAKLIDQEREQFNLTDQTLVYAAVFELLYVQLTRQLWQVGIIKRLPSSASSWCRVVYEKPFGHNYDSVHQLNQSILSFLNEEQIYRVDHYLAKEIVGNIAFVRFTNRIFEPLWNHSNLDSVQIILDEAIDIEGRGAYYERYGVIKDMVQNHVLQLMALIAMDTPKSLQGRDMQIAKSQILQKIVCEDGLLGQYEGYLQEKGVSVGSSTPTFAALKFAINDPRWAGVPFYVRTGKVMGQKVSKIVLKFKDMHCLLSKNCPPMGNILTISIYPTGGFELEINGKKLGVNDEIAPVKLSCCYDCQFVPQAPHAYENVLSEIMQGETTFAVRIDEIEQAWQISDQIDRLKLPVYQYAKKSIGPKELFEFNKKHQLIWI